MLCHHHKLSARLEVENNGTANFVKLVTLVTIVSKPTCSFDNYAKEHTVLIVIFSSRSSLRRPF